MFFRHGRSLPGNLLARQVGQSGVKHSQRLHPSQIVGIVMCKVILMALLAVASSSAFAEGWVKAEEWVKLDIISDYFVVYADPTSIIRSGNKVQMLSLIDHKKGLSKAGKTFMSVKAQHEFDCAGAQVRMLFASTHSENMGKGKRVATDYKIDNWEPVQPHSIAASLWKIACGK